jgi:hypothetical protein
MFFERERGWFASRTAGHNPVDATGKKKSDVLLEAGNVQAHCGISFKRGYDSWKDTFEHE